MLNSESCMTRAQPTRCCKALRQTRMPALWPSCQRKRESLATIQARLLARITRLAQQKWRPLASCQAAISSPLRMSCSQYPEMTLDNSGGRNRCSISPIFLSGKSNKQRVIISGQFCSYTDIRACCEIFRVSARHSNASKAAEHCKCCLDSTY